MAHKKQIEEWASLIVAYLDSNEFRNALDAPVDIDEDIRRERAQSLALESDSTIIFD